MFYVHFPSPNSGVPIFDAWRNHSYRSTTKFRYNTNYINIEPNYCTQKHQTQPKSLKQTWVYLQNCHNQRIHGLSLQWQWRIHGGGVRGVNTPQSFLLVSLKIPTDLPFRGPWPPPPFQDPPLSGWSCMKFVGRGLGLIKNLIRWFNNNII